MTSKTVSKESKGSGFWEDRETIALVTGFISTGLALINLYVDLM